MHDIKKRIDASFFILHCQKCQKLVNNFLRRWNYQIAFLVWFDTVHVCVASLIAQLLKNPPAMQETLVRFLGWKDPLEKE